jgi:hypothetical protein
MHEAIVVGICGYARSGKDSVAQILVEDFGFVRRGFADALRHDLLVLNPHIGATQRRLRDVVSECGWDEAKQRWPEVRRLMQVYGTDVRRFEDPDVWVRRVVDWVSVSGNSRVVVPDVRFPNEVGACTSLWRVDRPGVGPVNDHVSDNLVSELPASVVVRNDGSLDDLRSAVRAEFDRLTA